MKVLAVCRGVPGLGRVVPSLGLTQTLATCGEVDSCFATYAAGLRYLSALGANVIDLGAPDGLFIDPVSPQALHILTTVEEWRPDLVLLDGEFHLPATLAHLKTPVVYLANPHDLLGTANTFRRINRLLLSHAGAVLISSLACTRPTVRHGLVSGGVPCLEVPAITKEFPTTHRPATGPPRVLISTGGGSVKAHRTFRDTTNAALTAALDTLSAYVASKQVASVTVVLGADAALPAPWREPPGWLHVIDAPVELTELYADHELLVARAGRNVAAEALYCGIPAVLLPISTDPHRSTEQSANAATAAAAAPHLFACRDWADRAALHKTLAQALSCAAATRRPGPRGNASAVRFLTKLLATTPETVTTVPVPR